MICIENSQNFVETLQLVISLLVVFFYVWWRLRMYLFIMPLSINYGHRWRFAKYIWISPRDAEQLFQLLRQSEREREIDRQIDREIEMEREEKKRLCIYRRSLPSMVDISGQKKTCTNCWLNQPLGCINERQRF